MNEKNVLFNNYNLFFLANKTIASAFRFLSCFSFFILIASSIYFGSLIGITGFLLPKYRATRKSRYAVENPYTLFFITFFIHLLSHNTCTEIVNSFCFVFVIARKKVCK